jgi:hypothetical protein
MEGGVIVEKVDFKLNPAILGNMRFCLQAEAKIKNIKLQHPIEEYDMEAMLKMFKELESKPIHYTFNQRLVFFWENVIHHLVKTTMWVLRGFVFVVEKIDNNPEATEAANEFREKHNRYRKGEYDA